MKIFVFLLAIVTIILIRRKIHQSFAIIESSLLQKSQIDSLIAKKDADNSPSPSKNNAAIDKHPTKIKSTKGKKISTTGE